MRTASVSSFIVLLGLVCAPLFAQEASDDAASAQALDPAWEAALQAMQQGPARIALRDQAAIELPAGYGFVPRKQATKVMQTMGNTVDQRFLGLIFPLSDKDWFVSVDWEDSGYIKDDDARDWNADELLQNLKDGTEAANKHRADVGVPAIEVTRWVESPKYDATSHRLVWSAEARQKNGDDPDPTINYNTYVLGREGFISMNLITTSSNVESDKPAANELLAAVNFNEGKRYSDFDSSTDKVATYGLAELVGGVAAKKLGLLAMVGVFLAKFAKVILIGLAALGGVIAKMFRKKEA